MRRELAARRNAGTEDERTRHPLAVGEHRVRVLGGENELKEYVLRIGVVDYVPAEVK